MSIPILTYHASYISGNDYASNDHVAFYDDIRLIHRLGLRVVSLDILVDRLRVGDASLSGCVALTMDDGTNFDYYDLPHPTWGVQRSMLNIMADFVAEFGADAQPGLHATSFVVASPDARNEMDRACLVGRGWYTDEWWTQAIASGLMGIANHSWDHNHPAVSQVAQRQQIKGNFLNIDAYSDADAQIRRAGDFLARKTDDRASELFAYPFGDVNEYLVLEYLPDFVAEHKLKAAFATRLGSVSPRNGLWTLPRLVCHDDWHTTDELASILMRMQEPSPSS